MSREVVAVVVAIAAPLTLLALAGMVLGYELLLKVTKRRKGDDE